MDINVFYFSVRKQEQNTLQLQHSSLIKTVAEKVNSFQNNWLSRQLHWTRQFFFTKLQHFYVLPLVTFQICLGEFRFAYETCHTRTLFFERDVRTLTYSILAYAYPRAMDCFGPDFYGCRCCTRCCSCCRCCCRHRRHRYHYDLCILLACNSAFVSVYTWCSQVWRSDQLFAEARRAKRQSRSVQRSQHLSRSHLPVPPT